MKTTTRIFERMNNFKTRFARIFAFLFLFSFLGVLNLNAQSTKEFKTSTDTLVVYSDVPGLTPSDKYTIRVRSTATNNVWVDVFANFTYNKADPALTTLNSPDMYQVNCAAWSNAYGNIEMNTGQAVEVEIAAKPGFKIGGQDFFKAKVHPAQKASAATLVGGKVYFTITKPGQIYIDINGQMDDYNRAINPIGHPVHVVTLFANPVIKKPTLTGSRVRTIEPGTNLATINAINPSTYDTMYFKPGIHDIASSIKMHPGKTIYIPGDAYVFGSFNNLGVPAGSYSKNGEQITIFGYGTICGAKIPHYQVDPKLLPILYPGVTIDNDGDKAIVIENDVNCKVFGITLADNANHSIEINGGSSKLNWVKTISWRVNGDGLGGYSDAEDCFIRAHDDCSYVKANKKRCTFWKDSNARLFYMSAIPTDRQIIIEDCDVLYARLRSNPGTNGGGFTSDGGGNVNVIIRNIRFHDKLINMKVFNLQTSETTGCLSGVLFQNISIAGMAAGNKQSIIGTATSPWNCPITFDSLTIGGTLITNLNYNTYFVTQYVSNIVFNASVNYTISLSANVGGTVSGGGSFNKDQSITVTAIPAAGRSFVNWTESGVPVSTNANYTFNVTQNRTLVANFLDVSTIPNVASLTGWVSGNTNNKVSAGNRLMTVMVMGESTVDFSATSVTYGGQTMTKQSEIMRTDVSRSYAAIFTLNEAGVNAASSGNIVVSWSATPVGSSVYSILLANVNQTAPVSASATNSLTGTTVATSPLLAGNGDMVIMCGATAANNIASVNNGFTEQFESNSSWGDGVGGSKIGTGVNETPSFSQSVSGRMALCAIAVKYSAVVEKQNQTIDFPNIPTKTFGDAPFSLGATATSGLEVSYVSSNTAVATVSGNTATIVGAGTATITASQAGNANFNAAAPVIQTLTVNKADQTISCPLIPAKTFGNADFSSGCTSTSGLAISYTSSNTSVATIVNGNIHIVGAGTSTICASQAGNSNYNAAVTVCWILIVDKATQTIAFPTIPTKTFGDAPFSLGATATSGLAVSYVSSNTAVATVSGNIATIVGAGTATITASQAGNANFNAAAPVIQTLTVNKADQTISCPLIPAKTFGDPDFSLGCTSNSGLAVTYTSSNTAVATIVSGNIHIVSAGTANITASQAGNASYNAAPSVVQTLTVNPSQTLPDVTAITNWVSGTNNPKVAGSERMMVVMVMGEHTATFMANSATYGGQAMTRVTDKAITSGSTTYSALFILKEVGVNAATSGTINVVWSATPAGSSIYSVLLANVDQTTTIAKALNGIAAATTIATTTALAAGSGDMVVMCGATEKNNTITFNNGFTKKNESNSTWGDGVTGMKMGAGVNETPSFTQSASGRMTICAIVAKKSSVLKSAIAVNSIPEAENNVTVYPNPASRILNIDFNNSEMSREIKVFNLMGQMVYSSKTQSNNTQINVQSLNLKGMILVQVIAGNSVSNHRIMIK